MPANSNQSAAPAKPTYKKPRPDFPLFVHRTGRWAKKVRGKFRYCGYVKDDPEGVAALKLWEIGQHYWPFGLEIPTHGTTEGITVGKLCNDWLEAQEQRYEQGEITWRTFNKDYKPTTDRIVRVFGNGRQAADLRPEDFGRLRDDMAKTMAVQTLPKAIILARSVFKYAVDAGWLDRSPVFGPLFKPPARKVLRRQKALGVSRLFDAAEIRQLVDAAGVQMRAMILLGCNGGLGPADIGRLRFSDLDLAAGWLNQARGKTGEPRRVPLWPRTVKALQEVIAERKAPKDTANGDLLFVTKYGESWHKEESSATPISAEFRKLLKAEGLHREGRGHYGLRHYFETTAGDSRDQVAVNAIMGHVDNSMAGNYRHGIDDARLRDVVSHVEAKLFPPKKTARRKAKAR